jgi:5-methylcytosine-specific restriction endonuclease McrA
MKIEILLKRIKILVDIPVCENQNQKRKPIKNELRNQIITKQKGKCWICQSNMSSPFLHHIIPYDESVEKNLVALCFDCHQWITKVLHYYKKYKRPMARHFMYY